MYLLNILFENGTLLPPTGLEGEVFKDIKESNVGCHDFNTAMFFTKTEMRSGNDNSFSFNNTLKYRCNIEDLVWQTFMKACFCHRNKSNELIKKTIYPTILTEIRDIN